MKIKLFEKDWIYPLIVVIIGFFYYMSFVNYGISLSDEGFLVYGAERVLQGELPMSDFMSYPPGSYFLLAFLFKIFGVDLLISRMMEIFFLLLNGLMMFYVGKRLMPERWALIPSFILIAFPGPWHKVFFAFGLLLPLVALFLFLEKGTKLRILTVGWCLGIALVFKIECFIFSFITVLVVLFISHILQSGYFFVNKRIVFIILRNLSLCLLGLFSIVIFFVLYYHFKSGLPKLFYSFEEANLANVAAIAEYFGRPSLLKAVTRFRIGSLSHLFFYLIVLLYLYLFGKHLIGFRKGDRRDFSLLYPVLIIGMVSLTYAYITRGKAYLFQVGAMPYILFIFLVYSFSKRRGVRPILILFLLVFLLGLYVLDSFRWKPHFYSGSISRLYAIRKEGAKVLSTKKAEVYLGERDFNNINDLIQFLQRKRDYLLPVYFDPMVNFLSDCRNPTRFSVLQTFFFEDALKQEQIISEIQRYKIRYLLVETARWNSQDSFGLSIYAPQFYEFIVKYYRLEKEIGEYLIFVRK